MKRWWVSWYGTGGAFTYHGPWWISGSDAEGRSTFVAAVLAESEDAAQRVIADAHDSPLPPIEWRFTDERGKTWAPFGDRFPQASWMNWPHEEQIRTCHRCSGRKTVTETRTEPDVSSGIIYGVALGMGYFPSTKTVTETKQCPTCNGTGVQR